MRRVILAAALLLLAVPASAQFNPNTERIGLDYRAADIAAYQVERFEVRIDTGAWSSVGLPSGETLSDTLPGLLTYPIALPALTLGPHAVQFRACNATGCSPESAPYAFTVAIVPPATQNTRVIPPKP